MEKNSEFHLSYSRITIYDNCPLRYKFIYVDELPTAARSYFSFGNSIHKVLELFYQPEENFITAKTPSLNYLLGLLNEHWISAGYNTEYQEKKAKDEAVQLLTKFYRETIFGFQPAYLVEKSFSFELNGFRIIGRIDRIDQGNDGYSIIDYKTNKILPYFFKKINLLQPIIYYLGAKESLGLNKINSVFMYFVRFNKKVEFNISDEMAEEGKQKILQVGKAIQCNEFSPKPGSACSTCEFKDRCASFQ